MYNYEVVVVDNLDNSSPAAVDRVQRIAGKTLTFYQLDMREKGLLSSIFSKEHPDAVIHFAGLKAVGESVSIPHAYYQNNIDSTLVLTEVMKEYGCHNLIFSSSATVYGDPAFIPITEECPKGICTNPYGWTKWMIEQILSDMANADPLWNITLLRYFVPAK